MERLRRRAAFRAVAGGRRLARAGFVLQALGDEAGDRPPRFGITVTRKVGNAVVRNRIRRRLREALRRTAPVHACSGTDYVLVARPAALTLSFERLVTDLMEGFAALARGDKTGNRTC